MNGEAALVQSEVRGGFRRSWSRLMRCPYCRTVVRLGARKFRDRGLGLFIAWWRDLGDGRAGDEKWADQLRLTAQPGEWKVISYDALAIINAFDKYNMCYFDFDGVERRADRRELFRLSTLRSRI